MFTSSQLTGYVKKYTKLKETYFYFILNNHICLLMGCVRLLGTVQWFKPYYLVGHCHSHFLFHIGFYGVLLITAVAKTPA